ncbi:hypothetical protein DVH07_18425 [Hafnia paralvei]|nr:hypothetical protein DU449_17985 [Hafnia paralvei]RDA62984.1 hypothetical protein DVH08_20195 [Hafnia paralvei]RDA63824.1 hypothetical protein DVH09_18555 [Hafnia paralvei]RDA75110.1 hypothetical protein DVH10_17725 [Hafnia paralvei]RDA75515.1 hypothetical protein DVH07_18425 [Hafnia paralvei]
MRYLKYKQPDFFWTEVLRRSKIQLYDMNIGSFHKWRESVGESEVNRLLSLMELFLSPDNHRFEVRYFTNWINRRMNGLLLFDCFRTSGRVMLKQCMKGEIYCLPVLYVIIHFLINEENSKYLLNNHQSHKFRKTIKKSRVNYII